MTTYYIIYYIHKGRQKYKIKYESVFGHINEALAQMSISLTRIIFEMF